MLSWRELLIKYRNDENVRQLIFVQHTEGSQARIQFYTKTALEPQAWTKLLECNGYLGKNGLGKTAEGDMKTPVGDFGILTAFGIKSRPATELDYVLINEHLYCADDPVYYNLLIDDRDIEGVPSGEHMIDYSPEYNYGMFLDYNAECTVGRGSAIFFHCDGIKTYTAGCVAVSENDMRFILEHADNNLRVCIDEI